ncbi:hypothetical protein EJ08DRAFT_700262 [Tothia fuscella]|uniref:Uncharacterized protein n=1 Tax=Tothia fuscella TaxID=1048955 RepID=A0A9P4NKF8_9PEZI|nr:hypothetical protein EJ08DRAFT_700262 [Tothia fuscella]
MAPNPYLWAKYLFSPTQWTTQPAPVQRASRTEEHWDFPIPGTYRHTPGRGWALIVIDDPETHKLELPQPITYSKVTHVYMLQSEYKLRRRHVFITGKDGVEREAGLFLLDDNVTWVKAWNDMGKLQAPFERWVIDAGSKEFRPMVYGDDPDWVSRKSSRAASLRASTTSDHGLCRSCGSSPRAGSLAEVKTNSTGFADSGLGSGQDTGSALTTPKNGNTSLQSFVPEKGVLRLSAAELSRRLTELEGE